MGCTSSKPKRTKSLDDVQAGIKGSAANGQVTKDDSNIRKVVSGDQHQGTNPIQIPGANKSFLAPDGIPFIDEDVDDVRLMSGDTVVKENAKVEEPKPRSSALINSDVAGDRNIRVTVDSKEVVSIPLPQVSPVKTNMMEEEEAAIKIQAGMRGYLDRKKVQAIKQHSPEGEMNGRGDEQPHSIEVKPLKYDENTAATKIQANFKGYKTRKEIRTGGQMN